jgi:hypothetical protein
MFCNGMVTLLELAAAPGCDVLLTGGNPQRENREPRLEIYSPRMEHRLLGDVLLGGQRRAERDGTTKRQHRATRVLHAVSAE